MFGVSSGAGKKGRSESALADMPAGVQKINFQGVDDEANSYLIFGEDVTVTPTPTLGQHSKLGVASSFSSSNLKLKNIVDFAWEHKYTSGTLVTVHISGTYLAYGIKAVGKALGVVRVVNRRTEQRALLKGMLGMITDLSFAHIMSQVLLAVVDDLGNLFVYKISESHDSLLLCGLILQINQPEPMTSSENHRVVWCPWIPDDNATDSDSDTEVSTTVSTSLSSVSGKSASMEGGGEDPNQLLAVTHFHRVELWHIPTVVRNNGSGPHLPSAIETGCALIDDHQADVVDAAFSPDGTAIATASLDGQVKFFQVYLRQPSHKARCLHEWSPHDGRPVSSLFFLDNHRVPSPEAQFWKFAVTGSDNNTELKVWSCESWVCLQTLRFSDPSSSNSNSDLMSASPQQQAGRKKCCFKTHLDLGAGYLLLSDIFHQALYVIHIQHGLEDKWACFRSISEFIFPCHIIYFAIVDVQVRKATPDNGKIESDQVEDDSESDGDSCSITGQETLAENVVIRMYMVQPKSLQECHVTYQPSVAAMAGVGGMVAPSGEESSSLGFLEGFSDTSLTAPTGNGEHQSDVEKASLPAPLVPLPPPPSSPPAAANTSANASTPHFNLMTPDAFSSPGRPTNGHEDDLSFSQVSVNVGANILASGVAGSTTTATPLPPLPLPPLTSPAQRVSDPRLAPLPSPPPAPPIVATSNKKEPLRSTGSSPSREVEEILSPSQREDVASYVEQGEPDVEAIPEEETKVISAENSEGKVEFPSPPPIPPVVSANTPIKTEPPTSVSPSTTPSSVAIVKSAIPVQDARDAAPTCSTPQTNWPQIPQDLLEEAASVYPSKGEMQQAKQVMDKHSPSVQPNWQSDERLRILEDRLDTVLQAVEGIGSALGDQHKEIQAVKAVVTMPPALPPPSRPTTEEVMEVVKELREEVAKQRQSLWTFESAWRTHAMQQQVPNEMMLRAVTTASSHGVGQAMDQVKIQLLQVLNETVTATSRKAYHDVVDESRAEEAARVETARKALASTLATQMEKAFSKVFNDMTQTFNRGTGEYIAALDQHLEQNRKACEPPIAKLDEVARKVTEVGQEVTREVGKVSGWEARIGERITQDVQSVISCWGDGLGKGVKEELKRGFQEQQSAIESSVAAAVLRSGAATPAPHQSPGAASGPDLQKQLLHLLSQGQTNTAFQQALSASDLNLVTFLCERLNPQDVFGAGAACPLQQHVLLSLVQQLSADLSDKTHLKCQYLEEAILNLDIKQPITREHAPVVLSALQLQLRTFLTQNPQDKMAKKMRMLIMAAQSFVQN